MHRHRAVHQGHRRPQRCRNRCDWWIARSGASDYLGWRSALINRLAALGTNLGTIQIKFIKLSLESICWLYYMAEREELGSNLLHVSHSNPKRSKWISSLGRSGEPVPQPSGAVRRPTDNHDRDRTQRQAAPSLLSNRFGKPGLELGIGIRGRWLPDDGLGRPSVSLV
jgi:hypothetical protein